MLIRFKKIDTEERTQDAPFMGALISSIGCNIGCKGCFNQHLKDMPTQEKESQAIIGEIKLNPFIQGIILGGLEWSEQPEEMMELVMVALKNSLQVMIYSGLKYEIFISKFPQLEGLDIYIKCGEYNTQLNTNENIQYGIKLATSNQKIYKREEI